jgi:tripartite-type tricarboxylate transporter receptor subunit TctC
MKGERVMKKRNETFSRSMILAPLFLTAALFLWMIGAAAAADSWPVKQVELINPFAAGAAADIQARKLVEIISRDLGQPMVVRNVLGAGGAIAYSEVNRAKPDGHTLIWYSGAINTLAARKQIPFDYNAFEPIAGVGIETVSIAVGKNAPWKDFKEFIAYCKANPGKVTMGNSGMGSVTHMVPVAMAAKAGIKITHVPFGTGLAMVALLGGKIDSTSQHPAEVFNQVKAGEVRILAVSSEKRINIWPDVPTMQESGVDLEFDQWRGIAAPKGTPKAVIDKLSLLVKKAVESKEWIDFASSLGSTPRYQAPAPFGKFVANVDTETREIIAEAGLLK